MRRLSLLVLLCLTWLQTGWAAAQGESESELARVARGRKLLDMQGCTACHTLDGTISAGPSFAGRFGKDVDVLVEGKLARRRFDGAYLRESLEEPNRAVSVGYPTGVMPHFSLTDEQLEAMASALAHLGEDPPIARDAEPPPMRWLALFVLWFVGGHLVLSSAAVRAALVARLGEGTFRLVYSLAVTIGFLGTIWAYTVAPYSELWPSLVWTRYVPLVVMPVALFFIVCGLTTRTPTQIGQDDTLAQGQPATGILRITRHPQLWGYVLFSVSHLPPNGDAAALLFFGAFGALAVLGMVHIEHRRESTHGPVWEQFAAQTSIWPFGAIVEGRNTLALREIGWWRVALAAGLYVALLFGHGFLFGASPFP